MIATTSHSAMNSNREPGEPVHGRLLTVPKNWSTVDESRSSLGADARGYDTGSTTNTTTTVSSDDAVAQVGHARGFEHPDEFKCGLPRLESVEQALTRTEYHRVDLKIDLVD